jgi:hypothetical protein
MNYALITFFLLLNLVGNAMVRPDSLATNCKRNLLIQSDKILVTIQIQKPISSGFARIYEKLPAGAEVSKINCGNAVFKNEKSMLKIVWDEIPDISWIEISYELKLKNIVPDTTLAITGTFSAEFLPAENEQISILPGTKEYLKKETVQLAEVNIKIVEEKEEKKEEKKVKKVVELKEEKKIKKQDNSILNQPISTDTSVYICIQVAAVGKNIKPDYLKKQYGFDGEFESHFEENFYRITVGKFKSLAEAEAVLKDYKVKYFKKCFLSAYKNGHKIAVSDAEKLLN